MKTTLAPTWDDIGHLAAIVALRTILNYFLLHDISVRSDSVEVTKGAVTTVFGRKENDTPKPSQ